MKQIFKTIINRLSFLFIGICLAVSAGYVYAAITTPNLNEGDVITDNAWDSIRLDLINLDNGLNNISFNLDCTTVTNELDQTDQWNYYTTVSCPSGYIVTGGGVRPGQQDQHRYSHSYPSGNGWHCKQSQDTSRGTCYARCCRVIK